MKDTTQKILIIIGIFVLLNSVLVLKHFQAKKQTAAFADDSVIGQGKPVLLELGSHSCVPCKKMLPILAELNTEQAAFVVSFVDVWEAKEKSGQYGIDVIPTQIFFDTEGKELYRHTGFYPKEDILAKWQELGIR